MFHFNLLLNQRSKGSLEIRGTRNLELGSVFWFFSEAWPQVKLFIVAFWGKIEVPRNMVWGREETPVSLPESILVTN